MKVGEWIEHDLSWLEEEENKSQEIRDGLENKFQDAIPTQESVLGRWLGHNILWHKMKATRSKNVENMITQIVGESTKVKPRLSEKENKLTTKKTEMVDFEQPILEDDNLENRDEIKLIKDETKLFRGKTRKPILTKSIKDEANINKEELNFLEAEPKSKYESYEQGYDFDSSAKRSKREFTWSLKERAGSGVRVGSSIPRSNLTSGGRGGGVKLGGAARAGRSTPPPLPTHASPPSYYYTEAPPREDYDSQTVSNIYFSLYCSCLIFGWCSCFFR